MENLEQLKFIAILAAAFVLVLVAAQLMHRFLKVKPEHTRKFAHIAIGLTCVLVPFKFTNHWYLLVGTILFLAYLLFARKHKHLAAVYDIDRDSVGDLMLSVVIYLNALLVIQYDFDRLFYLPLLILTVADPAAYYGGKASNNGKKSWRGSLFFIVVAFVASWIYLAIFATAPYLHQVPLLAVCAVAGAVVEHKTKGGWDNLTVPLAVAAILVAYHEIIAAYGTH